MKTFKDFINDGKTVNEAQYFTIPNRVVGNQVYALMKRTKEMYDWLKAGNDFKQEDMEQIERLIAVIKNQVKLITEEQRIEEKYGVEVSVRDARKANDIARDMFRGEYKMDGSNVFVFKKKGSKEDFLDELESQGIEGFEEIDEATKYKFKKISYDKFERLGDSSDDYIETHIDGKSVIFITKNGNCIAMWYTNARVGSSCISFKGDELSYSEQDPNWPY